MTIDLEPIIEKNICPLIAFRTDFPLYVIKLANGEQYSTIWNEETIKEFQPNKTVSSVLKSAEDGIIRRHDVAVKAVNTNYHPTFKLKVDVLDDLGKPTGRYKKTPVKLSEYQKRYYTEQITFLSSRFGRMSLFKIIQ